MKQIGLLIHKAEPGKEVYYYSYYSKEKQDNSEPLKTKIISKVYETCGQATCFVEGVSGVVALTHLSFEYYPEKYSKPLTRSQLRYREYLEIADLFDNFHQFLKYDEGKRKGIYK